MKDKKFSVIAIVLSVVALMAIVVAVSVVFIFVINNPDGHGKRVVNDASVTEDANLTNWGFACEIDGKMYYSDHKTGIYISGDTSAELLVEGCYRYLCNLGDKIFCVESFYKDAFEHQRLVMIDVDTGNSEIVSGLPTEEGTLVLSHRAKDKIYFILDGDELYTVDQTGNIEYIGIGMVKKVTNSGIYANRHPHGGLRWVSFENEEIKTFDSIDAYAVEFGLEVEGNLYLRVSQDDGETFDVIKLDMKTGEYTFLPYQKEYGTLRSINYYDGVIYMTFYQEGKCYICKTELDSEQLTLIATLDSPSERLNLISIADDKLCVVYPYYDDAEVTILDLK